MKTRLILLNTITLPMLIFIIIYIVSASLLYFKIDLPNDIIRHLIFSVFGMTGIMVINIKFPDALWRFFSFIAFTHYIFSSLSNIFFSLFRNNLSAFQSMGSLANTDGFLVFLIIAYFLFFRTMFK